MKSILLLLTFLMSWSSYSQSVTTVTLGASEDSFTESGNPTAVNYTALTNSVYVDGSLNNYRLFIKFSLSSIPANSVIVSAILRLTPNGTENIIATNSTELVVDACNTTWSQTTLNHNSGISNNAILLKVDTSNLVSGKREFNLVRHVQAMVDGRVPNYGWRIKRNPETATTLVTKYSSKDAISSLPRPQLEVRYYTPAYVSAATIVHASSGASDGSISPTILLGSSATRSYQWYNSGGIISGAINLNLTAKPFGWYGLKSWGTVAGDTLFQAFLIGSKCEMVNISFNPGPNYIDDASITNGIIGSGNTATDYSQNNVGNSTTNSAEQVTLLGSWFSIASLIKFKLWVDPTLEVIEAQMTLYGSGHNPSERPNDSKLTQVAANWKESGVSFGIRPAVGSLSVNLPNMPAGNGNSIVELKDFFNSWKTNNVANYGLDFSLQNYINPPVLGTTQTRQIYQSSDNTNKPSIAFKVSWVQNGCDFNSYARFKDALDASFVRTIQGQLKIQFNEDYDQKAGRFTKLVLYDAANNSIKAGINNDGTLIGPFLLPPKLLEFDYNQHVLNLTTYSLVAGNTYILELTNSVGEKSYIKFKYYN
nr:DNRLRE domain-containing protein [uncultured Fluviicola sp.]